MAQFFPGDNATIVDTFDDNAWPYGISPAMYVRAIPHSMTYHDERNGASQFFVVHDTGNLIDVVDGEAINHPNTPSALRPATCYLAREPYPTNVRIELECDLYVNSGTVADQHGNVPFVGVWAKMHEGSKVNNSGTVDEYLGDDVGQGVGTQSFKGYGFYQVGRTGQGVRYAVVKLRTDDALGPEVLDELDETEWWPYAPGDMTNTRWGPAGMALEVGDVFGGDVLLNAYMRDVKSGGGWNKLMTVIDSSSPFTAAGRCGFSLAQIGSNGAGSPLIGGAKAQSFQIEELT